MQIAQARPPFVEFKQVAIHDPKRSVEAGHRVTKDLDMAFIMQPGSRDQVEIEAQAWLSSIKRKHLEATPDAYPADWVDAFHTKYEMWKKGQEAPVNGTSVKEWPILSPAEVSNFIAIGIHSVEDVAAMTEEAMGRVGMGARGIRDKAREWLQAKDIAAQAMSENVELKKTVAALEERLSQLEKPKKPPKE